MMTVRLLCAIRAVPGTGSGLPDIPEPLQIGKGRVLRQGTDLAILSLGTMAQSLQ